MEHRPRLKRCDPERIEPHRNFAMMYQRPGGAPAASARPGCAEAEPGGGLGDTVASGVRLAYRVIDEQISLGRRVAQQINERSYGPTAMAGDFREVGEKAMRNLMELGALWFEMLGALAGAARPAAPGGAATPQAHAGTEVALDVTATQPAQVMLDLHPHASAVPLTVYELHAPKRDHPPLTDLDLGPARDGHGVRLRLHVPHGQPAGVYAGVVVDETGTVRGTLTVRLGEPSHAARPATS